MRPPNAGLQTSERTNENQSRHKTMAEIRLLKADEIECRVGVNKGGWVSLLLYKNSRVDMAILDEVWGQFNWQRDHREIKGVMYAGVGVWNEERKEWVWKWDAGTESKTDPEKGEASDSFKRACVNWGIGRELYTAPFIPVTLRKGEAVTKGSFRVSEIGYTDDRIINKLVIVDTNGEVRYTLGQKPARAPQKSTRVLTPEIFEQSVQAFAEGKVTKTGGSIRGWLIETYNPDKETLARFDVEAEKRMNQTR